MSIEVYVKHAGKSHTIQLDINSSAVNFKKSISEKTGVPADRMKVMVKGGILKDDADLTSIGIKEHQTITVIGTAAPLPDGPSERPVFLEDLGSSGVLVHRDPPGLVNLGQTCYLNSSLQALRQIPQLKSAFSKLPAVSNSIESRFASSMRDLFTGMEPNGPAVAPLALLTQLRVLAPQFAEVDERSGGFAQQDADEVWTQIVSALRAALPTSSGQSSFVDDYMSLEMTKTSNCVEAPEEPASTARESALKLECNISISTNFLVSGIRESLDQQLEKNSPSLGRMAQYEQQVGASNVTYVRKSRLSRLPEYLAVHMVRFYWRRDIQKKAKIMRKVKYPLQLDVSELLEHSLQERTRPISAALKSAMQARDDRAKQIKQLRGRNSSEEIDEAAARDRERSQYTELVRDAEQADVGCNPSSMYELCALVTHKGASADSGHYIGWARKDDGAVVPVGEEEWYKYDDDKVTTVNSEKILAMEGGGQDSIAYILLYRALRP